MTEHIVIIGAGHAGITCAEQLRTLIFWCYYLVDVKSGLCQNVPLVKIISWQHPENDDKFVRRPEWRQISVRVMEWR